MPIEVFVRPGEGAAVQKARSDEGEHEKTGDEREILP
jgi:hypothetical protein